METHYIFYNKNYVVFFFKEIQRLLNEIKTIYF